MTRISAKSIRDFGIWIYSTLEGNTTYDIDISRSLSEDHIYRGLQDGDFLLIAVEDGMCYIILNDNIEIEIISGLLREGQLTPRQILEFIEL